MKYKNNPLNIRYSAKTRWQGQSGHCNGFCEFESLEYGIRAACYLILISYRRAGACTPAAIIRRWAPPSDNNPTDKYITWVCEKANLVRFEQLYYTADVARMVVAMAEFEQGKAPTFNATFVCDVIAKFKLNFLKPRTHKIK